MFEIIIVIVFLGSLKKSPGRYYQWTLSWTISALCHVWLSRWVSCQVRLGL